MLHQQLDSGGQGVLLNIREFLPPLPELVRVLDVPSHQCIIFLSRNLLQQATGDGPILTSR